MQASFKLSVKLAFDGPSCVDSESACGSMALAVRACLRVSATGQPGMPARGSGCLPVCSLSEPQAICANLGCLHHRHHEPACGAAVAAILLSQSAESLQCR